MIKVKKKHIIEAKKRYNKNKKSFMKGICYFKNITEEERIECIAEMLAECDEKLRGFKKKYPNGFPEIGEVKCNIGEIDWSPSRKWEEEENDK